MTRFKYVGNDARNIGRHGWVTPNQYLFLTDEEVASVGGDSRFVAVEPSGGDRPVEIAFDVIGFPKAKTGVQTMTLPFTLFLQSVVATLDLAHPSTGVVIDINKDGTSIFSVPLSIDANETSSETAAVPAVISDDQLPAGTVLTLDIDSAPPIIGESTVAGALRVVLKGSSPNAPVRFTGATIDPSK